MIDPKSERGEFLLDRLARGELDRRRFFALAGAAGVLGSLSPVALDSAMAANEVQRENRAVARDAYDYIDRKSVV